MKTINEPKTLAKHISCKCKCKFDGRKCNSNQKWNNNKCQASAKIQENIMHVKNIFGILIQVLLIMVNIWHVLLVYYWWFNSYI